MGSGERTYATTPRAITPIDHAFLERLRQHAEHDSLAMTMAKVHLLIRDSLVILESWPSICWSLRLRRDACPIIEPAPQSQRSHSDIETSQPKLTDLS